MINFYNYTLNFYVFVVSIWTKTENVKMNVLIITIVYYLS